MIFDWSVKRQSLLPSDAHYQPVAMVADMYHAAHPCQGRSAALRSHTYGMLQMMRVSPQVSYVASLCSFCSQAYPQVTDTIRSERAYEIRTARSLQLVCLSRTLVAGHLSFRAE